MKDRAKKFMRDEKISNPFFGKDLAALLVKFASQEIELKKQKGLRRLKKVVDYDDLDQAEIIIDESVGMYNNHFE